MPDPSKPVPLEAEVVEAAAKAIQLCDEQHYGVRYLDLEAQAAILAADEAREMRVEHGESLVTHPIEKGQRWERNGQYRLVSRWFPIRGPVDE